MHLRVVVSLLATAAFVPTALASCSSSTAATGGADAGDAAVPVEAGFDPSVDPLLGCTRDPGAPAVQVDPNATTDPAGGAAAFTLAKALDGFPAGAGKLTAGIHTESGGIKCTLDEAAAPISVANFVGLVRGTRPYKDGMNKWTTGHFYDGLTWHRVITGFVIQGGDPKGTGLGGPGYDVVNENHAEEPLGVLAMAAAGKPLVPSGSQFYIVVGKGPKADYNVFGSCATESAIAIAGVPVDGNDKPNTPVHMIKVEIGRCP
ncbi:MAG: peptidyl-prolyl cis-trans isomerase [Myxococcales bacterium]|nr:peptidyl-prolyl cis-trans isomerase [Myxococcales bacterium]